MPYVEYLRWEGGCSMALGLALAVVGWPGWLVDDFAIGAGLLFVPATLVVLGAYARLRHGASPLAPGTWLTRRSLRDARPGREALPAGRLRRRMAVETAVWVVAVTGWVVATGDSGLLVFGTGLASAAFGAVQAFGGARHVAAADVRAGGPHRVARRPGLGTPDLASPR